GGTGVRVGEALLVLRDPGVREPLGGPDGGTRLGGDRHLVRGAGRGVLVVAHEDFAPIHTAAPMSRPRPIAKAHRPSDTGPREPSALPPAEPSRCSTRKATMSRFSSGVMFASLNTGIDCGPVSIAW